VIYVNDLRVTKGSTTKAAEFNALAYNMEAVNARKLPRMALVNLSGNTNVTVSTVTGFGVLSFDNLVYDTAGLWSGTQLGVAAAEPYTPRFIRVISQLYIPASPTNIGIYGAQYYHSVLNSGMVSFFVANSWIKATSSAWAGVKVLSLDTGWLTYDSSITNYSQIVIGALPKGVYTINQNSSTWLHLEIAGEVN